MFYLAQAVFFGLLNDLFPSVNPPRLVNDNLNACVREVCEDMNLWPDDAFVLKVIHRAVAACTMHYAQWLKAAMVGWVGCPHCAAEVKDTCPLRDIHVRKYIDNAVRKYIDNAVRKYLIRTRVLILLPHTHLIHT